MAAIDTPFTRTSVPGNDALSKYSPAVVASAFRQLENMGGKSGVIISSGNQILVTQHGGVTTFKNIGPGSAMGDGGESMKMELGGFELGFVLVNIPNSGNSFKIDGKNAEISRGATVLSFASADASSSASKSNSGATSVDESERKSIEQDKGSLLFRGDKSGAGALAMGIIQATSTVSSTFTEINHYNVEDMYANGNSSFAKALIETLSSMGGAVANTLKIGSHDAIETAKTMENTRQKASNLTFNTLANGTTQNGSPFDMMNGTNNLSQQQKNTNNTKPDVNALVNSLGITKGKYNADGNYLDFGVESNSSFGIVVRGDLARMITDKSAVDVEIAAGPKQRELLVKAGWKIGSNGMLRVTAHELQQLMTFDFESGKDSTWMSQRTVGATLRIKSDSKFVEFLEVNGYISKAESKELAHKTFVVDSATFLRLYEDQRRIAGTSRAGLSGSAKFRLGENDTVKLTLGAEQSKEDTLIPSASKIRAVGGAEWEHKFNKEYSVTVGATQMGNTTSMRLMGNKNSNEMTVSAFVQKNISTGGTGGSDAKNVTVGVMVNIPLDPVKGGSGRGSGSLASQDDLARRAVEMAARDDGKLKTVSYSEWAAEQQKMDPKWSFDDYKTTAVASEKMKKDEAAEQTALLARNKDASDLIGFVKERVTYNPTMVQARIDQTAQKKLLAELDKTGLPAGATMDTQGNMDIPLGMALGTFVSGTNSTTGGSVPSSVFGLNGSVLHINSQALKPFLRSNSSVGSFDTITIVTSTATITFDAYVGSVHIKNVRAVPNAVADTIPPVTSAAPAISTAATDTTVSVSQKINENGTGYYLILPAAAPAPSVAAVLAGTPFAMTANTTAVVNVTGLTAGTAYKYYFVSKDAATPTPNVQTSVSTALDIVTLAADIASTVTAPTGVATTTTVTETNTIADANGVRNVMYYLYQADGTTPVAGPQASAVFTGLTASTTYKMKTTAETLNSVTGIWSLKTSPMGNVVTLAPAEVPPVMGDVVNQSGTVGTAFSLALASSVTLTNGDAISSYAITSGALPPGLTLNTTTGVISGTPSAAGTYNITVTATDNDGASNADAIQFVVSAAEVPPVMGDVVNQSGVVGTAFSLALASSVTLTNGDAISSYAITSGALPPGLTLNTTTGVISGTPATAGTYNVTVTASDNDGASNADAIQFVVSAVAPPEVPPVMGDVPNQTGNVGTAFNLALASSVTLTNGDTISSYAITSGALPPGLTLNTTTGVISGTPATAGTYNVTVTASDNDGASNADAIQFVIGAALNEGPELTLTPSFTLFNNQTVTGKTLTVTDANGDAQTLTMQTIRGGIINVTNANGGTITNNGTTNVSIANLPAGSTVTYNYTAPNAPAGGTDGINVNTNDGHSATAGGGFLITVLTNHFPAALDFSLAATVTAAVNGNWLTLSGANDTDGDTMTASVKTQGTKGTFSISGNTVTYTPNAEQTGTDSGVLTISDGKNGLKDITVSLSGINTITPVLPAAPTTLALSVDSGTAGDDITSNATFNWAAIAGVTSYQVSLNGTSWVDIGNTVSYNFGILSPVQGSNTAYLRGNNAAGPGPHLSKVFNYDALAPSRVASVTLAGPVGAATGYTNSTSITVTAPTVTDTNGVFYLVNEVASTPVVGDAGWTSSALASTAYTLSSGGNGTKTVYVWTKDGAGNIQSTPRSQTISLDTSTVSLSADTVGGITAPAGTGTFTMTFNTAIFQASDLTTMKFIKTSDGTDALGSITVASISGNVVTFNYTAPNITGGIMARISGKNAFGTTFTNIDSSTATLGDSTPPTTPSTLTLSGNAGATAGYTNTQSIALSVADVTDVSGVSWYVSESSSAPAAAAAGWSSTKPTSFTLSAGNGAKNVYVYVKDNAAPTNNVQSAGKTASITLDGTAPTISTYPVWGAAIPSGAVVNKSITFADTSGGSPKSVSISSGGVGSVSNVVVGAFGAPTTFTYNAPTNNGPGPINVEFTYEVTDNAGNVTTDTTQTVDVAQAPNTAPTASDFSLFITDGISKSYNLATSAISDSHQSAGSLIVVVDTAPAHGSLSWTGTTFTFTATGGYTGDDSFTYHVVDAEGLPSATKTVTLTGLSN